MGNELKNVIIGLISSRQQPSTELVEISAEAQSQKAEESSIDDYEFQEETPYSP